MCTVRGKLSPSVDTDKSTGEALGTCSPACAHQAGVSGSAGCIISGGSPFRKPTATAILVDSSSYIQILLVAKMYPLIHFCL